MARDCVTRGDQGQLRSRGRVLCGGLSRHVRDGAFGGGARGAGIWWRYISGRMQVGAAPWRGRLVRVGARRMGRARVYNRSGWWGGQPGGRLVIAARGEGPRLLVGSRRSRHDGRQGGAGETGRRCNPKWWVSRAEEGYDRTPMWGESARAR